MITDLFRLCILIFKLGNKTVLCLFDLGAGEVVYLSLVEVSSAGGLRFQKFKLEFGEMLPSTLHAGRLGCD